MTGGSANIAFTSMWFHSEMNIAFTDTAQIKNWVAQLWSEHLQVSVEKAMELIGKPEDALNFFKDQAPVTWRRWKRAGCLRDVYTIGVANSRRGSSMVST